MSYQISTSEFLRMLRESTHIKNIILEPKMKFPKILLEKTFEEVDFNSPILGGFLNSPKLHKCSFILCNFDGINADKSTFEECTFKNVMFGKELRGRIDNSKFLNCLFVKCKFSFSKLISNHFINCKFEDCEFMKINFNLCTFNNSTFSGVFNSVNWVECTTKNIDVSNVKMENTSLIDSDSYDIKLPDNKENFIVFAKDFKNVELELKTKLSSKSFEDFCYLGSFITKYPNGTIIDKEFFSIASKLEKEIIMESLYNNTRKHK